MPKSYMLSLSTLALVGLLSACSSSKSTTTENTTPTPASSPAPAVKQSATPPQLAPSDYLGRLILLDDA